MFMRSMLYGKNSSMKLIIVFLCTLTVHLVVGEVCPGGQQTCPSGSTCCELPSGRQGCCPYENATCCRDKVHCCPHGYDCLSSRCKKRDDGKVTELRRLMVDNEEQNLDANVTSVICPDHTQCEDGETCCPIGDDRYGCCPMAAAVCCSDRRSCCPHGYICSDQGGCERENQVVKRVQVKPKSVVCPGGRFKCPDYNTCCLMSSGHYGCCPIFHAVCCRDGKHCCPPGYTCDAYGIKCNKS